MDGELHEPSPPTWRELQRRLWVRRERSCAVWLHGAAAVPSVVPVLLVVSWLGNGIIWYATMALLPWLGGPAGLPCATHMFLVGLVDLAVYKVIKRGTARPRPFITCPGIRSCAPTLDEYSFPSGHTLHAVGFTMVMTGYYPAIAPVAWSFSALIAVSRVVLGLHYPSDVVFGACLGALVAQVSFTLG